jgi:hypothetical protein
MIARHFLVVAPSAGEAMETIAVLAALVLWCALVIGALVCSLWALVATASKKVAATVALCLWCTIAGGTLTSALWSWMTTANLQFQYTKIARMPPGSKPDDVNLQSMQMLTFFVKLDELGRRIGYLTIIIPLVGAIVLLRSACNPGMSTEKVQHTPNDEFFHPG